MVKSKPLCLWAYKTVKALLFQDSLYKYMCMYYLVLIYEYVSVYRSRSFVLISVRK